METFHAWKNINLGKIENCIKIFMGNEIFSISLE